LSIGDHEHGDKGRSLWVIEGNCKGDIREAFFESRLEELVGSTYTAEEISRESLGGVVPGLVQKVFNQFSDVRAIGIRVGLPGGTSDVERLVSFFGDRPPTGLAKVLSILVRTGRLSPFRHTLDEVR
jgi:hypothetical protein